MTAAIEAAKARFLASAGAWLDSPPSRDDWFRDKCPLLDYARKCKCLFDEEANTALEKLRIAGHEKKVPGLLPSSSADVRTRCVETMRGMLAAVEAGLEIAKSNWSPNRGVDLPAGAKTALKNAVECYSRAWGLTPDGIPLACAEQGMITNPARALKALVESLKADTGTAPAWLAVHRLLQFVLGEPEPPDNPKARPGQPGNAVAARMLLCDQEGSGYVQHISSLRELEGPSCWTIDPVALGLTVLEDSLIESLQLAWCACTSAMYNEPSAIRLASDVAGFTSLDGPSAGALFACAMYAAAIGEELNTDASASVELLPPPGWKRSNHATIDLGSVKLNGVGGLCAKLREARRHGILTVALTEEDCDEAKSKCRHSLGIDPPLKLVSCETLADVYKALTGNARIERVLEAYCKRAADDWEATWTGQSQAGREYDLAYYVPARYALLKPEAAHKAGQRLLRSDGPLAGDDDYQPIEGETEEDCLTALLRQAGPRLCLSEGPGAGKSVFTRRLLGYLATPEAWDALSDGKALLPVRWEDGDPLSVRWPKNFTKCFLQAVKRFCPSDVAPAEVVNYALLNRRVVLILDALDQASKEGKTALLSFLDSLNAGAYSPEQVRIVLTGRPYAVEHIRTSRLPSTAWRFGKVLPFDSRQQYQYFRGPEAADPASPEAWRRRAVKDPKRLFRLPRLPQDDEEIEGALRRGIAAYDEVKDLLSNPQALRYIRLLSENSRKRLRFRTRSELYIRVSHELLTRGIERVAKRAPRDEELSRAESLLAAAAFEMMARHPDRHVINGSAAVLVVKRRAGRRVSPPVTPTSSGKRDEWRWLEQVSVLTNRTLLAAASDRTLAWPDRRMMEFYAGLHLARNDEPHWLLRHADAPRCGNRVVRQRTADPRWAEAWRFAIAMPAKIRKDPVLLASLAELFQPVSRPRIKTASARWLRPDLWLRPTELMYHAWPLLEDMSGTPHLMSLPRKICPLVSGGSRVIRAYQEQFLRILLGYEYDGAYAAVSRGCKFGAWAAAQLVPESLLEQLVGTARVTQEGLRPRRAAFVCCPAGTFQQGTLGQEGTHEHPHQVSLSSFLMQTTTVTRAQYALFDGAYLAVNQREFDRLTNKGSECPALNVTWFDAWCFARWIGGRLPTEAEWEYACRAGSQNQYCRVSEMNAAKGYSDIHTEDDLDRVAYYYQTPYAGPQPVASLEPNHWGVYDMIGNVSEWCADWYDEDYYDELDRYGMATDPKGPTTGSHRVLRGGSYIEKAIYCRAAIRGGAHPSYRTDMCGFRLARGLLCLPGHPRIDL